MRKFEQEVLRKPRTRQSNQREAQEEVAEVDVTESQHIQTKLGDYFLFFLLLLSIAGCYLLFRPYLNAIIIAVILAILLRPVYFWLVDVCNGRRSLAAFLTCVLLTLVVVIPLTFIVSALIQQGIQAFNSIYDWVASGEYKVFLKSQWIVKITTAAENYLPDVQRFFPEFKLENFRLDQLILQTSAATGKNLMNLGGHLFGNVTSLLGQSFLMLFTFFFVVRDQESMFKAALHLIPLSTSQERQILDKIKSVAQSALLGTFLTALAQGIAGGIAFQIAGLPGLFWGAMMAFASLIPVVGTTLIWLPAAVYLFLAGRWGYGTFMLLWCAIVVGSIDNFLRPVFMKGSGQNMGTLVIFFSLLGGINYFGLIGLLYGPLIVGLTMVFLYIYSLEYQGFLDHQDRS